MVHKINKLQRQIMRRVYYAFALRLGTSPLMIHGLLLGASMYTLSMIISIPSILNNIKGVRVGDLDNYIFNTVLNTEFWTLALIGIIFFTVLSLNFSLKTPKHQHMQMV